ncbi:MAG: hypothetical protein GY810_12575 [Aureispira sp.]|nr:hypothetical protein [Aureispira sp.]
MKFISFLIGLMIAIFSLSANAQASKNTHQVIALGDTAKEIKTLNIHIYGKEIKVIKVGGSRVQVKTRVSISLNNLPFLNYLMESGRYKLESIPNGGDSSISIQAKFNKDIVIQEEPCSENISYVFYVPEYIENVQIHNLDPEID